MSKSKGFEFQFFIISSMTCWAIDRSLLTERVTVMKGPAFLQETVVAVRTHFDLPLTDAEQIVYDQVLVEDLEPQHVILLGFEVRELFLPPGIGVVFPDCGLAQGRRAAEDFDEAVADSQDVGREVTGVQVEDLDLGLGQA